MIHYIINFIVYTLAIIGLLIIGFIVYKKAMVMQPVRKNSMLKIMEMLRLPDRKVLYIIRCKNEQFLIASSNDKVTLISKLDTESNEKIQNSGIERYLQEKAAEENYQDDVSPNKPEKRVIKSLLKELSDKNQFKRGNY